MKNILIVIVAILTIIGSANAQLTTIVDKQVQFAADGAGVLFGGPYDVSALWDDMTTAGTLVYGSDSSFVLAISSTVFNSNDAGQVDVDFAISNEYWTPSAGFAGTAKDSLAVPYVTNGYEKWFRPSAADNILCAADADTAGGNADLTTNQTVTAAAVRFATSTPKKYLYVRYIAGAANDADNKMHHVVLGQTNK